MFGYDSLMAISAGKKISCCPDDPRESFCSPGFYKKKEDEKIKISKKNYGTIINDNRTVNITYNITVNQIIPKEAPKNSKSSNSYTV
jgi:hypothetical protein